MYNEDITYISRNYDDDYNSNYESTQQNSGLRVNSHLKGVRKDHGGCRIDVTTSPYKLLPMWPVREAEGQCGGTEHQGWVNLTLEEGTATESS